MVYIVLVPIFFLLKPIWVDVVEQKRTITVRSCLIGINRFPFIDFFYCVPLGKMSSISLLLIQEADFDASLLSDIFPDDYSG